MLLKLASKIRDSQVHQYHDIILFGPKSRRAQYEKGQRDRENRKDKKSIRSYHENKVDLVVRESSNFETNVYYYIIYCC